MAIFLVQHGISESKKYDPVKGLSHLGIEETDRIAPVAKAYAIPVARIVHSGKKRAEQTAAIYHKALGLENSLDIISGINPLDDVRAFAATIDPQANWMVVGHMPFLERLVSYLIAGSEDILIYQFQNSGIVCLDSRESKQGAPDWFIKWTLNPNIS